MTDQQALIACRVQQARETLQDAQRMLAADISPRSVINRAYYAAFYAVMALLLRGSVPLATSRHTGIITLFDTHLVHPGTYDITYSSDLHLLFSLRLKGDYREEVILTREQAGTAVAVAARFCALL